MRTDQCPSPPRLGKRKGTRTQPNSRSDESPWVPGARGIPPCVYLPLSPIPSTNPSSPSLNPSHPPSVSPLSASPCNLSFPGSSFTRESPPRRCHYPSITNTTNSVLLPPLRSFQPARTAVERPLGIPLSFSRSLRGFPISPSFSSSRCIARPIYMYLATFCSHLCPFRSLIGFSLSLFLPLAPRPPPPPTYPIVSNGLNLVRVSHSDKILISTVLGRRLEMRLLS